MPLLAEGLSYTYETGRASGVVAVRDLDTGGGVGADTDELCAGVVDGIPCRRSDPIAVRVSGKT